MRDIPELLAPAGSVETLYAAFAAGADAAYIGGGRFGARAYADNAQETELLRAIDYARLHGKRLYLTVNTLLKEGELEDELYAYLLPFWREGLDAVIVQDLGVMRRIREWFPGLHIHVSTQMTAGGAGSAKRLEGAGASRIVLPRELSLQEIRSIRRETGLEIECFIHGALCYCYSGQCLFSSIAGGRSGNRGRCAQPCRLPYKVQTGRGEDLLPQDQGYILSPKDLCTIDFLPDLVKAGINSLKIEGRMKKPEYTAGVVSIYRKYLDRYLEASEKEYTVEKQDRDNLAALFNRKGFTDGYYTRHNGKSMITFTEPDFRRENEELTGIIREKYLNRKLKEKIKGRVRIISGEPAILRLELCASGISAQAVGDMVGKALNRPLSAEEIKKQTDRIGDTDFIFEELSVETDEQSFYPVGRLNELRRTAAEKLKEAALAPGRREESGRAKESEDRMSGALSASRAQENDQSARGNGRQPLWRVEVETEEQLKAALDWPYAEGIYLDARMAEPEEFADLVGQVHGAGKRCYLAWPGMFRQENAQWYEKYADTLKNAGFDGWLAGVMEAVEFAGRIMPGKGRSDHSVYCWNRAAREELAQVWGIREYTLPLELKASELIPVSGENAELLVYGRVPMMVSAGCIRKNTIGCKKGGRELYLTDRLGNRFPVKNYCRECMNVIFNCLPLMLLPGREKGLPADIAGSFRISFTVEDARETRKVLEMYGELIRGGAPERPQGVTRGHLRRGVE